jgi:alcohol dehydrogenase
MNWVQFNPVRVVAGPGCSSQLDRYLPDAPILLLTSAGMARRGTLARLRAQASPARHWTMEFVAPNADLDTLDTQADALRGRGLGAIVALGGGSVMDAAKALSVLLPQPVPRRLHQALRLQVPLDYGAALPVICLPTTAGTGAEVTPFATIWDGALRQKHSLADEALYARAAMLDPELTLALPWQETLHSALDATSHALETLWNRGATPVGGALALQALRGVVAGLPRVQARPDDLDARARLQEASLLAGLAISQSRTALAHSMSYPLTAHFGVPHGLACSYTLAALLQWVQREGAWAVAPPADLRDELLRLLAGHELGAAVRRYCQPDAVLARLDEMFSPQRAGNFVIAASRSDALEIISASLS